MGTIVLLQIYFEGLLPEAELSLDVVLEGELDEVSLAASLDEPSLDEASLDDEDAAPSPGVLFRA